MKTFNNIPVYSIRVLTADQGVYGVSLVDWPAMDVKWEAFAKTKDMLKFSVVDDEEHKVMSVLIRCDFPILRRDEERGDFYVVFDRETTENIALKFLQNGAGWYITLDHNDEAWVGDGVKLQQIFLKDSARGIAPEGFDEVADGSLFGVWKIENEDIWKSIKEGTFNGMSLEGRFTLAPEEDVIESVEDLLERLGITE